MSHSKKNLFWTGKEDRRTWWFWSTVRRARRRRLALIDNDAPSKRLDQISSISDQGLSGAFVMCLYRRHGRRSAESADAPNSIDTSKILREREKSPGKERSKAGRRTCADRCCLCVCVCVSLDYCLIPSPLCLWCPLKLVDERVHWNHDYYKYLNGVISPITPLYKMQTNVRQDPALLL